MTTLERIVHGTTADGHEIVRYDRAGKWYVEKADGTRTQISVKRAAELATRPGAQVFEGRYGGRLFRVAVRRRRQT